MAVAEANNLRYWYRNKYNLSLHDPRYTAMSDEEIVLEYETYLAAEGKPLLTCSRCGYQTHRGICPECDIELSGDADVDDIFARIEAGEEVNLDDALRGGKWEPIKPKGA